MSLVKADIVKNISTKTHLTASDSRDLLESFLSIIKDNIHSSKVKISNFGTFESKTSPQRLGRNPDNEYSGRPLVFSNRGETEVIEEIVEAYNNKDVEGFLKHFADEWQATDHEGNSETRNKADARERMQKWFDQSESIEWKPWSIVPLKIYDTDPLAGVTVYSTEKRVGKDGSVWEKKLVEWFYFDIDGKIQAFDQYAQDIKTEE